MSAYARQLQAAQRQYESQAECDQHGRRPTGPDDGDLYADGWQVGRSRASAAEILDAIKRSMKWAASQGVSQ